MGADTKYNSNLQKNSVPSRIMSQIEELRAFVTIVETGSLTQAADRLGIAVSAVSRRLRDLELRLGTALIQRSTHSMMDGHKRTTHGFLKPQLPGSAYTVCGTIYL